MNALLSLRLPILILALAFSASLYGGSFFADCRESLSLISNRELAEKRDLLGGEHPRKVVQQFGAQGDVEGLSLEEAIDIVNSWIGDYLDHPKNLQNIRASIERVRIRIEFLEETNRNYKKSKPDRILLPPGVDIHGDRAEPIPDNSLSETMIASKSHLKKLLEKEKEVTLERLKDLEAKEIEMQGIRFVRFQFILRIRHILAPDSIHFGKFTSKDLESKPVYVRRTKLYSELEALLNSEDSVFYQLRPSAQTQKKIGDLVRYDRAWRVILSKTRLTWLGTVWEKIGNGAKTLKQRYDIWLAPLLIASALYGNYSSMKSQLAEVKETTNSLVVRVQEEAKGDEARRQEAEAARLKQIEQDKLNDAKAVAEDSDSWDELKVRFKQFVKRFPAEASVIFAQKQLGKRADYTPDGSLDPFYFKVAEEIDVWYQRIMRGWSEGKNEIIHGVEGRLGIRTESSRILDELFNYLERRSQPKIELPKAEVPTGKPAPKSKKP